MKLIEMYSHYKQDNKTARVKEKRRGRECTSLTKNVTLIHLLLDLRIK